MFFPRKNIKPLRSNSKDQSLISHNTDFFEIRVLDKDTGRGVPLVEFNLARSFRKKKAFVTDSAGRIAIQDPALMNRVLLFETRSHGYQAPNSNGLRQPNPIWGKALIKVVPGGGIVIRIKRLNIAERIYRLTGEGIYRDSVALGYPVPIEKPLANAQVQGQDTGGSILFKGKVFWSYGDTSRIGHKWGTFRSPIAISELPENGGLDPAVGVNLHYIENDDGFVKEMYPKDDMNGNMVWPNFVGEIEGKLLTYFNGLLPDKNNNWPVIEKGVAVFDEEEQVFRSIRKYDLRETWRTPISWGTVKYVENGVEWLYMGWRTFANKRAPAKIASIIDPESYEAFTCLADGSSADPSEAKLLRDSEGRLVYRWTKAAPPIEPFEEMALIEAGLMKQSEARFLPIDVDTGNPVIMHTGRVDWNEYRQRWVFIGAEGKNDLSSPFGEIWYAEAKEITGPWTKAVKVASHEDYSLYNPTHLYFFDQEGGRIIYFDGCYSVAFSKNRKNRTELYDYNMIMYRLDLSDPRIKKAWID